jgi:hypothetical protein
MRRELERVGRNEALVRGVNEHILRLRSPVDSAMTVLCECGLESCTGQFEISVSAYERVRSHPGLFLRIPGHERRSDVEVVEDEGVFLVVRKRAEPNRSAGALDLGD